MDCAVFFFVFVLSRRRYSCLIMCVESSVDGNANIRTATFTLVFKPCKVVASLINKTARSYIMITWQLLFL